jgi:anaphase-promoting complex subunit 6
MTSTPPPGSPFNANIPQLPYIPSPSGPTYHHPRASINSSFSFGPQSLVNSFVGGNPLHPHPLALDPNRSVLPSSPLRSSPRAQRRTKGSTGRHPLAIDNTDVFQDSGDEPDEDIEWGMVDRMRLWRHDALMQHLYDTAAFWGDKVLSWTSTSPVSLPSDLSPSFHAYIDDPNDAFWLAQTYFMTHRYSRAERLLTRPFSTKPPVVPFDLKGKAREPDFPPRLPVGPAAMVDVAAEQQEGVSRLVDMSVVCRYLAAQCLVRQGKWAEATEMLGEANPFRYSGTSIFFPKHNLYTLTDYQDVVGPRCPILTVGSR